MDSTSSSFNETNTQNLIYTTNSAFKSERMQKSSSANSTSEDDYYDTVVFKKELNKLMILSIELHDFQFKVCIRQFKRDSTNHTIPSTYGIIMDIFTWYDFFKKLLQYDLVYATSSFVANNSILVLNTNSEVHIQNLNACKLQNIKLNENQFELLKQAIPELNKSLINFLFTEYLPYLIRKERRFVIKSCKSENLMMTHLISWIEHDLTSVFKKVFECNGCKRYHINPLNHECITFNNLEKFNQLGHDVLMLVDISSVISNFLNHIDFVTEHFLYNINVEIIKNVLFK